MKIRPPGFVTRTISLATSKGLGANMAPKMLTTRSKVRSCSSCRLDASPSWNRRLARLCSFARRFPASTRLRAMSTPSTSAPSFASGNAVVPSPHPRSRTFIPFVMPRAFTSASPLSRMLSAMRVKSPFSHRAWFGFMLLVPSKGTSVGDPWWPPPDPREAWEFDARPARPQGLGTVFRSSRHAAAERGSVWKPPSSRPSRPLKTRRRLPTPTARPTELVRHPRVALPRLPHGMLLVATAVALLWSPDPDDPVALRAARLLDVEQGVVIEDALVIVEGEKI